MELNFSDGNGNLAWEFTNSTFFRALMTSARHVDMALAVAADTCSTHMQHCHFYGENEERKMEKIRERERESVRIASQAVYVRCLVIEI